jgi:hypothetical protein
LLLNTDKGDDKTKPGITAALLGLISGSHLGLAKPQWDLNFSICGGCYAHEHGGALLVLILVIFKRPFLISTALLLFAGGRAKWHRFHFLLCGLEQTGRQCGANVVYALPVLCGLLASTGRPASIQIDGHQDHHRDPLRLSAYQS